MEADSDHYMTALMVFLTFVTSVFFRGSVLLPSGATQNVCLSLCLSVSLLLPFAVIFSVHLTD